MNQSEQEFRKGFWVGVSAFVFWGLLPIYWRELDEVGAFEVILLRLVLSAVLLLLVLRWQGRLRTVFAELRSPRQVAIYGTSGLLVTINWFVFVWATQSNRVVEASFGYFLIPLLSVALGAIVLKERFTMVHIVALALAAAGVGVQMISLSRPPWIALSLAVSFGLYGLIRKQAALGPLAGLTLETLIFAPAAAVWLVWLALQGEISWGDLSLGEHLLLLMLGVVTAAPLLGFAYGARRLRLSTLGLLQYIPPSMHFFIGWLLFSEPLSPLRIFSFVLIWIGLAVYGIHSHRRTWTTPAQVSRSGG